MPLARSLQPRARWLPARARSLPVLAIAALLATGCDFLENPDEVQNSSNKAFLEAQVFVARDDRTPVEGVIMYVEPDPDSERSFEGPDQTFTSDENGFIRAAVFPGVDTEQEPPGGAGTPLEATPFLFYGDACVLFFHDGAFFRFSCGVGLGAGRVINIGTFFLTDFGALPQEE